MMYWILGSVIAMLLVGLYVQDAAIGEYQAEFYEEKRERIKAEKDAQRADNAVRLMKAEVERVHVDIVGRERRYQESRDRIVRSVRHEVNQKLEIAEQNSVKLDIESMGMCVIVPVHAWPTKLS